MGQLASEVRVLIVPGLNNSGPGHWQTRWQQLYPAFERVEQVRWDSPELEVWSARLDQVLRSDERPTVIVAHSFGCLTAAHRATSGATNLIGALLVAPADPEKFGVSDLLCDARLPCPSILIGSTDDPWMTAHEAAQWARTWGSKFVNAGAVGHINAESDLGYWMFGLLQLQRLLSMTNAPAAKHLGEYRFAV